jgi:hypothetical protein
VFCPRSGPHPRNEKHRPRAEARFSLERRPRERRRGTATRPRGDAFRHVGLSLSGSPLFWERSRVSDWNITRRILWYDATSTPAVERGVCSQSHAAGCVALLWSSLSIQNPSCTTSISAPLPPREAHPAKKARGVYESRGAAPTPTRAGSAAQLPSHSATMLWREPPCRLLPTPRRHWGARPL